MLSDRAATQLISQSFGRELTADETMLLDEHLKSSERSRQFQELASNIESIASAPSETVVDEQPAVSELPTAARDRLQTLVGDVTRRPTKEHRRELVGAGVTGRQHDLAFASALLQSGRLTEAQLSQAASNWRSTGGNCLGDHLVGQGYLSADGCHVYESRAARLVAQTQTAGTTATDAGSEPSNWSLSNPAVERRLSVMLGFEDGGGDAQPAIPVRQLDSRYTLIRKLGQGGLGVVWLARDETLKRTVAIKEVAPDSAGAPQALARFRREAEVTGRLEHPNVVPLYQFGEDHETGMPFAVMRFVGKTTLGNAIQEYHERREFGNADPMELHRLLTSFINVCQAIGYAHSRNVIHRDLKPDNVALDSFGQVVVLDWGLARFRDEIEAIVGSTRETDTQGDVISQTREGEVLGTPLYMSPEQAAGELDSIDEKTDIYGLGTILFAILTGSAPHEKSHITDSGAIDMPALMTAIVTSPTPSPRDYNPNIPRELEAICMKAMARQRSARHESASALANDVERWMAGEQARREQYDDVRMEGRELSVAFNSAIRDLGINVRFMSRLPPIQGIIAAQHGRATDDTPVWRNRLATIFEGLLHANSEYAAVTYCRVDQANYREVVRVERHSTDLGNIRSVPSSRLSEASSTEFVKTVIRQKPEEVLADLLPAPAVSGSGDDQPHLIVAAAVPVYDEETEEPFGMVMIERSLDRIFDTMIRERICVSQQVLLIDQRNHVLLHHISGKGLTRRTLGRAADELITDYAAVGTVLKECGEFIDTTDRMIYATNLQVAAGHSELTLLLILNQSNAAEE